MHTLEVLKSATLNSAKNLIIINESPLYNLRNMYSFGALTTENSGEMVRKGGIIHTIKDGIVIENAKLMKEVENSLRWKSHF